MKFPTEPLKLHFFYVVIILLIVVTWVTTWAFADDAIALSHISLASSIASLILAVLAIVYAYVSNVSMTISLHQVAKASEDLVENTERLAEVRSDLESYSATLVDVQSKVSAQSEMIQAISVSMPRDFAKNPESIDVSESLLNQFVERLNLNGQFLLYTLSRMYQAKGMLAFEDLGEGFNFFHYSPSWTPAYIEVFSALGIVEIDTVHRPLQENVPSLVLYTVTYFHPFVATKINETMHSRYTEGGSPTNAARYTSDLQRIDEIFQQQTWG